MEIPFAKGGSILKFEASCEKNEKNVYGEEFKVIPFLKSKLSCLSLRKHWLQTPLKQQKNQPQVFIQDNFFNLFMYWSGISVNNLYYS